MGKSGMPHTVPTKVTGKCGSVQVRLIPAPRGTGLVSSPAGKRLMSMAGITDCYSSSRGHTRTMGNFIKAIFYALRATYGYLSPELWKENEPIVGGKTMLCVEKGDTLKPVWKHKRRIVA